MLLDNEQKLLSYVQEVPEMAWQLIEYSEKPLTIIYPSAKNLAPNIIAEDDSIAIRICRDEFCSKLIQRFRKPIASTSANISGENFPENFSHISDEIINGVDYVVDLRQHTMEVGIPSTLIKMGLKGEIKFLRE